MAAPKTMSGARAKLAIVDATTQQARVVGIFNSCSYGLVYDAQPVYILGRYSPAEIEYTAQEPVQVTATGWRTMNHGPHTDGRVPRLQDLLTHEYAELALIDRQTELTNANGSRYAKIRNVRPTGYTTTVSARGLQEITVTYIGILCDDEDATNAELGNAANLP